MPHSPVSEMITLETASMSTQAIYRILIGAVVPRPIALVSTLSPNGAGNLAPFSYFNAVSSNPPCLSFSIAYKPDGSKKDTLKNIEATGQFVVNTVSEWMAEPMNHTSADYDYGIDEMSKAGFTPLISTRVKPPRVAESPVHFECETHQLVPVGTPQAGAAVLVIGRIVAIHVHAAAYQNGKINIAELKPLARLGGLDYGKLGEVFELPRPTPR